MIVPQRTASAPPRLIVRTMLATFAAIALVLVAVFFSITMDTRARVTRGVAANLDASQRAFAALERRRQADAVLQAAALAESPTLKAALDTYQAEARFASGAGAQGTELRATVQREVEKLTARLSADALMVVDNRGRVLASAGPRASAWPVGSVLHEPLDDDDPADSVLPSQSGSFRVVSVPLTLESGPIGALLIGTALDQRYARELADLSRAQTAILLDARVIATTLPAATALALQSQSRALSEDGVVELNGDPHAVRRLFRVGRAEFYAVDSIGVAAAAATAEALSTLGLIGLGGLALGGAVSLWLARTLARPINALSQQLRHMAAMRSFSRQLPLSGSSEELDALTETFNALMASLQTAEAQTELAYLGVIKALAAALDARDPYTAGHSERVSALAVMVGERMQLPPDQLDVLRLGALLHDIGKIGIRDRVLTKNGPLTDEEYEVIKTHPAVGAHILRQVPFLSAHLPIVELHHEQPDGRGYPHGLLGQTTPLLARIVHVADAFDAMTSARAYRPAQSSHFAVEELKRCRGSQFDSEVVDAFLAAWTSLPGRTVSAALAAIVASTTAVSTRLPFDLAVGE